MSDRWIQQYTTKVSYDSFASACAQADPHISLYRVAPGRFLRDRCLVQGSAGQLHSLIDLDAEGNLPAWFSSFQLGLVAIGWWVLAARHRATQRPSRRFLRICGGFFLLLSIDETALFHERITESLGSRYLDWVPAYLSQHIDDVVACVTIVLVCIAFVFPNIRGLWRLSPRAGSILAAGCSVYVTGAAVLESIGYRMLSGGSTVFVCRAEVAGEEFLEMLGASLILYAVLLLCCIDKERSETRVQASPMIVPRRAPRVSLTATSH
jgi:hypothetical protein